MPSRNVHRPSLREQVQIKFAKRAARLVDAYQCLIVSADPKRREMFEHAATEGGWKTVLCPDAPAAQGFLNRSLVQLAVVDLEAWPSSDFRPVIEQLTARAGPLLIVCGNEGDIEEEVWIRQSGAWLYLPGVIDGTDFSLLCGEARQIAERLSRVASPQHALGSIA